MKHSIKRITLETGLPWREAKIGATKMRDGLTEILATELVVGDQVLDEGGTEELWLVKEVAARDGNRIGVRFEGIVLVAYGAFETLKVKRAQ